MYTWAVFCCLISDIQTEAGSGDEADGAASDTGGNKSDDDEDDKEDIDEDAVLDEDDLEEVRPLLFIVLELEYYQVCLLSTSRLFTTVSTWICLPFDIKWTNPTFYLYIVSALWESCHTAQLSSTAYKLKAVQAQKLGSAK